MFYFIYQIRNCARFYVICTYPSIISKLMMVKKTSLASVGQEIWFWNFSPSQIWLYPVVLHMAYAIRKIIESTWFSSSVNSYTVNDNHTSRIVNILGEQVSLISSSSHYLHISFQTCSCNTPSSDALTSYSLLREALNWFEVSELYGRIKKSVNNF